MNGGEIPSQISVTTSMSKERICAALLEHTDGHDLLAFVPVLR